MKMWWGPLPAPFIDINHATPATQILKSHGITLVIIHVELAIAVYVHGP